jgi:hypothetical protein
MDGEKMHKKMLWAIIALAAIAVLTVPVGACDGGGCWLTAGGKITNLKGVVADFKGTFGGNAMTMKDGDIRGEWNHVDHLTGDHFHGEVAWLECAHIYPYEGPDVPKAEDNYVEFGGTGTINGVEGYMFEANVFDIHEGGIHRDGYMITVWDAEGHIRLFNEATSDQCDPRGSNPIGCLAGGNIQIHPSNNGHPYSGPV